MVRLTPPITPAMAQPDLQSGQNMLDEVHEDRDPGHWNSMDFAHGHAGSSTNSYVPIAGPSTELAENMNTHSAMTASRDTSALQSMPTLQAAFQ